MAVLKEGEREVVKLLFELAEGARLRLEALQKAPGALKLM